jgi:hypothetical protein
MRSRPGKRILGNCSLSKGASKVFQILTVIKLILLDTFAGKKLFYGARDV